MIVTKDNMREVGRFLLDARKKAGLTLLDVEADTNLKKQTVSQLELCKAVPRLTTLVILADEIGLEIEIRASSSEKESVAEVRGCDEP